MSSKKSSTSAVYYVQRLVEDDYMQGQLRDAASSLRSAYGRASKEPARAAEDEKLYGNVRQAATSIRKALTALRRPEAEPAPEHRLRAVAIAFAVVGASVLVIVKRGSKPRSAGTGDMTGDALDRTAASDRVSEPRDHYPLGSGGVTG